MEIRKKSKGGPTVDEVERLPFRKCLRKGSSVDRYMKVNQSEVEA